MSGVEDARNVVAAKLPRSDPRAGVFGYDEVARPEQITDGTSQTIMVVGSGALANPWILGGGATIRGAREPLFRQVSRPRHARACRRRHDGRDGRRLGAVRHRPRRSDGIQGDVHDPRRRLGRSGKADAPFCWRALKSSQCRWPD